MITSADAPQRVEQQPRKHILAIAGTGRAGTSFLVRYLADIGLDTTLSRESGEIWHEQAYAGLETMPIVTHADQLPYVVKSPWISEFIDQLLAQPDIAIDLVIVPVRDLVEVASSRVIQELRAIHESSPSYMAFDQTFETWGHTPGGMQYSLNPIDQARILAVGFHKLVQRVVDADVPIIFLSFPRLATDSEYLFTKLKPYLPPHITHAAADAAHRTVADADKVRVGAELASGETDAPAQPEFGQVKFPDRDKLDLIAIRRELTRLNAVCAEYQSVIQTQKNDLDRHGAEAGHLRAESEAYRQRIEAALSAAENEATALRARLDAAPLRRLRRLIAHTVSKVWPA